MTNEYMIPIAPEDFRSGFVGIIGRPNVGKSTLMNKLVGEKIAITSPVAQTTRNRLKGILTTEKAQVIFVDTPGIHKPHHELGKIIVANAQKAINIVDVVLFVVDSSEKAGGGDRYILNLLEGIKIPVIIGLNKADQQGDKSGPLDSSYLELIKPQEWPVVKFSAFTGEGTENLLEKMISYLTPGPYYYPPNLVTDQPERLIIAELIREQILFNTRQEVPHSVAIEIEKMVETPEKTTIYAAINVERDSQKGIIIGKQGTMLSKIRTRARQQIKKLIASEIALEIFVKVEPDWRRSRLQLGQLGYSVEE